MFSGVIYTSVCFNKTEMTEFGETVERVLELLGKSGKASLCELEETVPSADALILDFMKYFGLIDMKNGEIEITGFGLSLQNLE